MMLKVSNIDKRFGDKQILIDFSFEISKGELVSILGPSGVGKSTLLQIISGIDSTHGGQVFIDGKDVTSMPPEKRPIGYVFQKPLLFPHMTVYENMAFALRKVKKLKGRYMKEEIMAMLKDMQLDGLEKQLPNQLSGGQQQRVAIARALIQKPKVLLMDEPFSSLDPTLRQEMGEYIQGIRQRHQQTILFVTHDREESMALSNRVLLTLDGQVDQLDTPENMYYHPASPKVGLYMGRLNIVQGSKVNHSLVKNLINEGNLSKSISDSNKEITLGIRPDDIGIEPDSIGQGTITQVERKGKYTTYKVDYLGEVLEVNAYTNRELGIGDTVKLKFRCDNIHIFG